MKRLILLSLFTLLTSILPAQILPTPAYVPVTAAGDGTLRTPSAFWSANAASIGSALSLSTTYQPLADNLTSWSAIAPHLKLNTAEAFTQAAAISAASTDATDKVAAEATARTTAIEVETTRATTAEGLLVPQTITVNGHALSGPVSVTPTDLSLVIGTNTQAWSANLDSFATYTAATLPVSTATSIAIGVETSRAETAEAAAISTAASDATTKAAAAQAAAIAASAQRASNLSDLASASSARTNLGLGTLATQSGTFSGTSSGTNTGDQTISITGDATASGSTGALTVTVTKINGTSLSALGTGILKNTTSTGVPSIAVPSDFPTLNQNTTGTAANLSGTPALPNGVTATTQTPWNNSGALATTAYADTKLDAYAKLSSFTTALAEAGAIARGLTIAGFVTGTASTSLISMPHHHRSVGDKVKFSALTGGAGLAINTPYYVIADGLTADAFKLSTTVGGSAVSFSTDLTAAGIIYYSRRVNVIQIGDSTGGDIFGGYPFYQANAAYGFGGLQAIGSLYNGGDVTLTNVSYNSTRVNSMLGQYSMDTSGATVFVRPSVWTFPQAPSSTFSGYTQPPQSLTGFRVVWIKGSGSFKLQHSAYVVYGDAAWTTPTWVDDQTVDTSTGSAPVQKTESTLPAGLYQFRIIQTAGTPLISYWGFLGASGFNRGGCYGQGGDYLSNYLITPEANWAAHLAISNPDLITLQFKNNGADTPTAWTSQLNTLIGYIHSYAPLASVVFVGNYNSQWDDSFVGTAMTMPQQRAILQAAAAANGYVYIDATQVIGATYALANDGKMTDTVHANDAGKAALTGYFTALARMFTPGDCLQPYLPPATGVTAGTYTSVTTDAAGRVTAGSNPAPPVNYYTGTSTMTLSADTAYTPTAADDGKLISVVNGSYNLLIAGINTGSVRDGFNVSFIKTDTGSGYICQNYASPWVVNCGQQGEGVQLIQDSGLTKLYYRRFQMVVTNIGAGKTGVQMKFTAGTPSGFGDQGSFGYDTTNHLLYFVNNGGGAGATWVKVLTSAGTASIASGKTFTASNTLTLTGTDSSTLAIGTGGTLGTAAYTATTAYTAAPVGVPASASAAGVAGTWSYDSNYHYVCVATNTWLRSALSTW